MNLYYDPSRTWYDKTNIWKELSGTPTADTLLKINNAEIISFSDFSKVDLLIKITIPTAPTAGDVRYIWLWQKNSGIFKWFVINWETFKASVIWSDGHEETRELVWDSSWTNAPVILEIKDDGVAVNFFINGIHVGVVQWIAGRIYPSSVYLYNKNADSMNISYIQLLNAYPAQRNLI